MSDLVTLYYANPSRASMTRLLLEELGAPHELVTLDLRAGDQLKSEFLAVNPLGKVPTIRHRGEIVTETAAIFIYLADAFAKAGLAPALDDRLRGPYLRWMVFYAASFEPAVVDRARKIEPGPRAMSPYGEFDAVWSAVLGALRPGPYILGERFSAADVLWGAALSWMTAFKLAPPSPEVEAYLARHAARPAVRRLAELEAAGRQA
jgi:glutathione S-transferase